MSLHYDINKTTDKDIVLAHTHSSKTLQIMSWNQFCLRRQRHPAMNYCKCSILDREKQLFHDGRHVSFVELCGSTIRVKSEIRR